MPEVHVGLPVTSYGPAFSIDSVAQSLHSFTFLEGTLFNSKSTGWS